MNSLEGQTAADAMHYSYVLYQCSVQCFERYNAPIQIVTLSGLGRG